MATRAGTAPWGASVAAGDELGVPYERHGDDLVSPAEVAYRV